MLRMNDNPFEPDETIEQQDRRIGRMIRDNADKRMTLTTEKRRLAITCSKEIWRDQNALVAWIQACVVKDCNSISYAVVPSSEITVVRTAVNSEGDFNVTVFFRCFPCEPGTMVLQGEVSTTFEDSSELRYTAKSADLC
jgi:hypothetical protein